MTGNQGPSVWKAPSMLAMKAPETPVAIRQTLTSSKPPSATAMLATRATPPRVWTPEVV